MTDAAHEATGGERPGNNPGNGRRTLVMIFLVGFVPVLVAIFAYFSGIGVPSGRSNHGELLQPVQSLAAGELRSAADQQALEYGTDQPWRLLILPLDDCTSSACTEHLDLLRRMQVAMARHADRLQRCLLANALPESHRSELRQRFPALCQVIESGGRLAALARADDSGLPSLLIIDPLGNIVLRYTGSQNPRDILEDLKRMLKVSRIG